MTSRPYSSWPSVSSQNAPASGRSHCSRPSFSSTQCPSLGPQPSARPAIGAADPPVRAAWRRGTRREPAADRGVEHGQPKPIAHDWLANETHRAGPRGRPDVAGTDADDLATHCDHHPPRHLGRRLGITQKQLGSVPQRQGGRVPGPLVHFPAVIRLNAPGEGWRPATGITADIRSRIHRWVD